MLTRIVCTMGPASQTDTVLLSMIEAGMSFGRLNFSHGTADDHRKRAEQIRRIAETAGRPVELIQDLQGPKIRTVGLPRTELRRGDSVLLLRQRDGTGGIPISEPSVLDVVQPGHHIYLDDGEVELQAVERVPEGVRCRILIGGVLEGNQGVVFPSSAIPLPALTQKDLADAAVGREIGVEWVALSFVQRAEDVEALRPHVGHNTRIIAKIETPAALDELDEIVEVADAVMVARGDLGVSIRRARVPLVQKDIVGLARNLGKMSIVATEMLLSMVQHPHPTRAEVADVAHAVLDGCNAVMLSEETAIGAYPAQAVAEMRDIVETVEASGYYHWGPAGTPDTFERYAM
jgi:pyruvate kinase